MGKRIIYQVLPRLWGGGKFSDWTSADFAYLRKLGIDDIWFTGIPEHASGRDFVKGEPGCPYAIEDWFSVNSYLADNPDKAESEFKKLVKAAHKAGFRVYTDFIPNHLAKDYKGPIPTCGYCDYDWTDTVKVDYSNPATVKAMTEVLRFWAELGVDGFRCDMVELVPSDALASIISGVRKEWPDLTFIAEVYQKENYRRYLQAGFDLLYDKSGMYDILRGIFEGHRSARELTGNWLGLQDMQPHMLNFLENHDEQRAASGNFMGQASKSYASLAMSLLFNNASFLVYFGQELGESASESDNGRTSIFNWTTVSSIANVKQCLKSGEELSGMNASTFAVYSGLLELAHREAFSEGGTWDLCYCNLNTVGFDPDCHFAFVRYTDTEAWLVVCNFSAWPMESTICIPDEIREVCGKEKVRVEADSYSYAAIRLR